jgi:hypothetical protein
MTHYNWSVRAVDGAPVGEFAAALEKTLNDLEADEFEVDDVLDAPGGRELGVVVVGKKPRRHPMVRSMDPGPLKRR